MEWISVKERLPELKYNECSLYSKISISCLISDPQNGILTAFFCTSFREENPYWQETYGTSCDCCAEKSINPTHWMPLPEPPKDNV